MDDLYADLENYNEVYTVEELRNENKDLKLKLEEYETAMGKLQKDYDNLAMEFQNLQKNYSSLLKTARAEVERKTQMITQLSLEKDKMIMQALQNGNRRLLTNRNSFRSLYNQKIPNPKSTTNVQGYIDKKAKKEQPQNNSEIGNESCTTSSESIKVPVLGSEDKLLNIVDKVVETVEACISKGELKENIPQHKPVHENVPKKLLNRRKSMPAIGFPMLSSDEDSELERPTEGTRNEMLQAKATETRDINTNSSRISNERISNKTSDTSSIEGRSSSYQEPARDGYRSKIRHYDSDKHRVADRIRGSDRIRESDRSREANRFRNVGRFRDSDRLRDHDRLRESNRLRDSDRHREFDKYREVDKYRESDKFRETDRLRDSDRFWESDRFRESDKFREMDKYRDKFRESDKFGRNEGIGRNRDKYDPSQKYRKYSPDRPLKRLHREYQNDYHRTEHGNHRVLASPTLEAHGHYPQRSQENQGHLDRQSHDNDKFKSNYEGRYGSEHLLPNDFDEPRSKRQKVESELHINANRRHHDSEPIARLQSEAQEFEMLHTSCQSPDAAFSPDINTDETPEHIIKEIKNVAATPLEDPRITSKKYVLSAENGKTTLTTAVNKSMDIRCVDKSLWKVQSVAIPDALLHKPQLQFNEEHIKEIYKDIEKPESDSNMLVKTGANLCNLENKLSLSHNERETETALQKQSNEVPAMLNPKPEDVQHLISTYKIPKVKKRNQHTHSEVSNVTNDLLKISTGEYTSDKKRNTRKDTHSSTRPHSLLLIDKYGNIDDLHGTSSRECTSDKQENTANEIHTSTKPKSLVQIDKHGNLNDLPETSSRECTSDKQKNTTKESHTSTKPKSLAHIDKDSNLNDLPETSSRECTSDKQKNTTKESHTSTKPKSLAHIDKDGNLNDLPETSSRECTSDKQKNTTKESHTSTKPKSLAHIDKDGNLNDLPETSSRECTSDKQKNTTKESHNSTKPKSLAHIDKYGNLNDLPETSSRECTSDTQKNTAKESHTSTKPKSLAHIDKHDNFNDLPETSGVECSSAKQKITTKESYTSTKSQSLLHIDKHDTFLPAKNRAEKTSGNQKNEQNRLTLSDIAMVEGDLELSDETSDNVDLHKQMVSVKETVDKTQFTVPKKDDFGNKNKSNFQIICMDNIDNAEIVDSKIHKSKDSDGHKKQKSKRRKTKSKEKELGEGIVVGQTNEKKTKSKKDKESKPNQIKNMFTDLFGDSSSLITPEDLGIPAACVPLCEDAQDAVDINIKAIVQAPQACTASTEIFINSNKTKIHDETTYDTNLSNPSTEDKEIAKRIEEKIASPIVDGNDIYENLNSHVEMNKPEPVKTVIISSGIQPQFALGNKEGATEKLVADVEVDIQKIVDYKQPGAVELKNLNCLKALATSTPHKECTLTALEAHSRKLDSVNNLNDSKNESVDSISTSMDQTDTNTQNSHDAPDVRIFVRRRRKGVKKN